MVKSSASVPSTVHVTSFVWVCQVTAPTGVPFSIGLDDVKGMRSVTVASSRSVMVSVGVGLFLYSIGHRLLPSRPSSAVMVSVAVFGHRRSSAPAWPFTVVTVTS